MKWTVPLSPIVSALKRIPLYNYFLYYFYIFLFRMLIDHGVQERLMGLLKTDYMASSLKLLILRSLDATTNCPAAMENFLGWNKQVSYFHC